MGWVNFDIATCFYLFFFFFEEMLNNISLTFLQHMVLWTQHLAESIHEWNGIIRLNLTVGILTDDNLWILEDNT